MPNHGNVVIAVVNGDLTVKRFHQEAGQIRLMPENPDYDPIVIDCDTDWPIWGVVTRAIHFLRGS
jgi:DNA polymerase V